MQFYTRRNRLFSTLYLLVAVLFSMVLTGCNTKPRVIEKTFGTEELAIIQPKFVEAFRVKWSEKGIPTGTYAVGGTKVVFGPEKLSQDVVTQWQSLLKTQETDSPKGCEAKPILALRFHHEHYMLDVVFCFKCDMLICYRGGREVSRDSFANRRAHVVRLTKQIFPRDGIIRKLEEVNVPEDLSKKVGT